MDGTARIVIIGNGFDLHYNIASSYRHYKEWLTIVHPELWQKLERYINANGEWWNDFERNLAEFDIRKIIKESPRYYPSRNSRFPPSPLFLANQFFEIIRKEITDSFVEWIKTLSINDVIKNVELPEALLYISFNYTNTLAQIYGIPKDRILYIHGNASRGDKLIFGHSKSHYEIESDYMRKYGLREIEDFYDNSSVISNEEYQLALKVSSLDKFPYTQIVGYSGILLPAVKSSSEVVCFGFSFSEVDFQYLEWIAAKNPDLLWKVSWHLPTDISKVKTFFRQVDITNYTLFQF